MGRWRLARLLLAVGGVVALAQPALASSGTDGTTGDTAPPPTLPASTQPASTEPASTEPASTEPASTEPASTEPADTSAVPSPSDAPPVPEPVESPVASSVLDTVETSPSGSVPEASDGPDDTTVDTTVLETPASAAADALLAEGDIQFVPPTVDFGRVEFGEAGDWTSVVVAFTTPELEGVEMDLWPSGGLEHSDNGLIGCAGNACSLEVRFVPDHVGQHSPTLTITLHGQREEVLGTLHGTGTGTGAGSLSASPESVDFGGVEIDTTSPPVVVEIRNTGQAAVDLVGSDVVGPFSLETPAGTACDPSSGIPLGAQESCTVSVTFSPDGNGQQSGHFDLEADNGDVLRVGLAGRGDLPSPITISPTDYDFGAVDVGEESAVQRFTVRNTSEGRVFLLGEISATGPFVLAPNDCGTLFEAGDSCNVAVTFVPTDVGPASGVLDVPGRTAASLTGEGTGDRTPQLEIEPAELDFGHLTLGSLDLPDTRTETLTVRNTGDFMVTLDADDFAVARPFTLDASGCARQLIGNATCEIAVTFEPTTIGAATGQVDVNFNGTTVASAELSGSASNINIEMTPPSIDFGEVATGSQSEAQRITLRNRGGSAIAMAGTVAVTGPFVLDDTNCEGVLSTGASCWADIAFTPTEDGPASGSLEVHADDMTVATAALTGTAGDGPPPTDPELSISPVSHDFGEVPVGGLSERVRFDLVQPRGGTVSAMTDGPFEVDLENCNDVDNVAYCEVWVAFAPVAEGPATGWVTYTVDDAEVTAEFSGNGTGTSAPSLSVDPTSWDFGPIDVGEFSATKRFTISNGGSSAADIGIEMYQGGFIAGTDCDNVGPGDSCYVDVRMSAGRDGPLEGQMAIEGPGFAVNVPLYATGVGPPPVDLSIAPTRFDFGDVAAGESASEPFAIINDGTEEATNLDISTVGPFAVNVAGCTTVAANSRCEMSVTFEPTAAGAATGQLEIRSGGDLLASSALAGVGTGDGGPALAFNPSSHDFGAVFIGDTSAEAAFTLEIPLDAEHSDPRVTGPFAVTRHFCDAEASPDETTTICAVGVTFQPTAVGPATGTLMYTVDGVDVSASLSGEGSGGSQITIDPSAHDFGSVEVGSMSAETLFTVRNDSPLVAMFAPPLDITGPFALSSLTCSSGLQAGESCQLGVVFAPTEGGPATGAVTINGERFVLTAVLSGTGASAPAPDVSITPTEWAFGDVTVGARSAPSVLTISNDGTAPASIDSVSAPAPFAVDGSACTTIAPGSSCDVIVTFAPTSAGAATGTLTVAGDGFADVTAELSGSGVLPLSVTPAAVDFGSVTIGHEATAEVTVTNLAESSVPLSIGDVPQPSPFTRSTTCTDTLPAGASCTITVTFEPVGEAAVGSSLTVGTPADGSVQSVDVVISGAGVPADVGVADVAFGDVAVGSTGTASATVRNNGAADLRITELEVVHPFGVVDQSPCVTTLAPGASCTVDVRFAPTTAGSVTGTFVVRHPGGPSIGRMSARGTAATLTATSPVDFGSVLAGGSYGTTLTFTNTGNVDLELQPASTTGPFQIGEGCTGTLAANATCDLDLQYAPGDNAAGQQTGTVSLAGTAPGLETTASVDLRGFAATADVTVTPTEHDFGTVALGRYTPTRTSIVSNQANVAVAVSALLDGPPDFAVDASDCAGALAPGASCEVLVSYEPTGAATHSGSLSISASMALATGTHEFPVGSVDVVGTAAAVAIRADGPLEFGDVPAGEQSPARVLTVTNDGPEVGLTAVAVPDGFDIVDDTCTGAALPTGATCTISVAVSASADGVVAGDLSVTLDTDDEVRVAVSTAAAVAVSGAVTAAPDTVEFGDVAIGDTAEQQLTITNDLNVATELQGLTLAVPSAGTGSAGHARPSMGELRAQAAALGGPFQLDAGDCADAVLDPGGSCTVTLRFAPTAAGQADAVLSVASSRGSLQVALSGTGTSAPPVTTVPGTGPGTTIAGNGNGNGNGNGAGTDGELPETGGGLVASTVALAIGLVSLGVVLVVWRRRQPAG